MYNPLEAKKSYLLLLKEQGSISAFKSLGVIAIWYCLNELLYGVNASTVTLVSGYFIFAIYFTWKPKLVRFLRGELRGKEFRDK